MCYNQASLIAIAYVDSRDELVGLRDKLISSDTETVSDEVTLKKSSKGRRIIRQAASSDDVSEMF